MLRSFYGAVGRSQIQQQSPGVVQFTVGDEVTATNSVFVDGVKAIIPKVKEAIQKAGLEKEQKRP